AHVLVLPGLAGDRRRAAHLYDLVARCTSSNTNGSLCSTGSLPTPVNSHAATYAKCSSSRSASPSSVWYSSRKCPPQLSLRCSASLQSSSANSRKSATRPAFSSDWFIDVPSPSTRTFFQNSSRIAGISDNALSRLCSLRDMPQLSHSTLPSS